MKKLFAILLFTAITLSAQSYSGGAGTEANPYQISNLTDLTYLMNHSADWSKHFIQTANINASSTSTWNLGDHDGNSSTPNEYMGWSPLGNETTNFTGSYDGNEKTISGLFINRAGWRQYIMPYTYERNTDQGFFGIVGVSGVITDLILTNVNITGSGRTGGLVGKLQGTVSGCSVTSGTVSIDYPISYQTTYYLGGLIGYADGNSIVTNSYTSITVTTEDYIVGGLIGYTLGNVSKCYSTSSVTGRVDVGGLIGTIGPGAVISECYATGNVSSQERSGGFTAGVIANQVEAVTIRNCYSRGNVTNGTYDYAQGGFIGRAAIWEDFEIVGTPLTENWIVIENCYSTGSVFDVSGTTFGFIGSEEFGEMGTGDYNFTYLNNFWDSQASNQSTAIGATAKTTTQMQTLSTFTNWDFINIWEITSNNYPTLRMGQSVGQYEEPTTQASNIIFSGIYSNQITLSWTNGDGSSRVVFAKQASSGTITPTDNLTYAANTTFGGGTQIGATGWYCIYNGSGSNLTLTGLSANTDYVFQIFEYNGSGGNENYFTSTATENPNSQSTNNTSAPTANYALTFDGINDYTVVENATELNMAGSSFTLEAWLKSSAVNSNWMVILEYGTSWTTGTFGFHSRNQNEIKVDYFGRTGSIEAKMVEDWTDGKWHHFAGVLNINDQTLTLYMDGIQKAQISTTGVPGSSTSNLYLASRNGSTLFYDGQMDEVRIWNVARSQADIQTSMCKKLVGNESGLVAYYKMTDGNGTTLSDNSVKSNNGTLFNMDNEDWVTSGAAIGDESTYDYDSPSSVTFASNYGDNVTVSSITGSPSGVQIYRVDSAPNVTIPPGNLTQLSTEYYFGVFIAGGTTPTYTLTYNYDGHPGITNESALDLAYRANNATEAWIEGNATLNTTNNTLLLSNQSGTEYILSSETGNALPVELTSFTAIISENKIVLNWQTSTEVNNYGFDIERLVLSDHQPIDIPVSDLLEKQNLQQWERIGFIEGHGNSNSQKTYEFIDESPPASKLQYRLKQIDLDGKFEYSDIVEVGIHNLPTKYALEQNYPNPFNPTTSIEYSVVSNEYVSLKVYDLLGNEVATLVNQKKEAGKYRVSFDASKFASGVYVYRLTSGSFNLSKKMILIK